MKFFLLILSMLAMLNATAQKTTQYIQKGNEQYRQKQYQQAKEYYVKSMQADKTNAVAQFNAANASQRMNKFEEASKLYAAAAANSKDPFTKAQAFYNQGLSFIHQNKLPEAIDAFKKSLRLNANDNDTRDNLQKALKELQQQQQKNNDKQDNKNKKKPQDKDQPQKPKTKLSKEEADKLLNSLQKEEKNLQKQVQKKNQSSRQLKDW